MFSSELFEGTSRRTSRVLAGCIPLRSTHVTNGHQHNDHKGHPFIPIIINPSPQEARLRSAQQKGDGILPCWIASDAGAPRAAEAQHGAAAAGCMMYAICLQGAPIAILRCVPHVRPRLWQINTFDGASTQEVQLSVDSVNETLLKVLAITDGLDAPVYPKHLVARTAPMRGQTH